MPLELARRRPAFLSTTAELATVPKVLPRMTYLRLLRAPDPAPVTDNECVRAFDRELDYVFETLRRLGAPPGDIEDLVHDVFVVLFRNWPTLDLARPLRPYLFGVAFRIVCAHRRRRVREVPHPGPDAVDAGPSAERALQSREAEVMLRNALERVPLPRRAVLIMHELDGTPITEIARALSITRFGAYARLRKGHRELAAALRSLERHGAHR
jgi:RNA polymerase sigma-70 factor (ECF subfamily)